MKTECTLTDEELIERANEWVSKLAKSGGRAWTLEVPVNSNKDPDMLFVELGKRLQARNESANKMKWVKIGEGLPPISEVKEESLIMLSKPVIMAGNHNGDKLELPLCGWYSHRSKKWLNFQLMPMMNTFEITHWCLVDLPGE